jgi:polyhydroxyalkanoate synthesis regulator phasin
MKDALLQGVGKLMQSEQAMKLMQNEAVIKALTKAFTATTEARLAIDQQVASVVKSLKLATRDDLKTLRRNVERLERELTALRRTVEENALVTSEAVETARIAARAADAARARAEAQGVAQAPTAQAEPSPKPTKAAPKSKSAGKAKASAT